MAARAIVVGVARTSFEYGTYPFLSGVATDVHGVAAMLGDRGFDVRVLTSRDDVSVQAVTASLSDLVDRTMPGDLSVIYLTGHGAQIPSKDPGEDALDEAFVCSDKAIPDNWFRDNLWPRQKSDTRIVGLVDACHSETILVGILPVDGSSTYVMRGPVRGSQHRHLLVEKTVAPITNIVVPGPYRLALAACRDAEETSDLGAASGSIVTSTMLGLLERGRITYRDLWNRLGRLIPAGDGAPQYSSVGPSDSLLDAPAFQP